MKKSLFSVILITLVAITSVLTACEEKNPLAKAYDDSASLTEKPASWSQENQVLDNRTDSASYLMGYIFGGNLNRMIQTNRMPELKNINRNDFERGVAIALQADSAQLDLLYGIMIALDLRHNLTKMTQSRDLDWNSRLTYRGFYQGFNNTIPSELPLVMAEDELTEILYPDIDKGQEIDF
ncbi:MAG: hypothetical protein K2M07_04690 [Muribaculaceae bacterium]|nr:hypothetical protein [Muribaculaceae bacterium]